MTFFIHITEVSGLQCSFGFIRPHRLSKYYLLCSTEETHTLGRLNDDTNFSKKNHCLLSTEIRTVYKITLWFNDLHFKCIILDLIPKTGK